MNNYLAEFHKIILFEPDGFRFLKQDEQGEPISMEWSYSDPAFLPECTPTFFRNYYPDEEIMIIVNTHVPMLIPSELYDETVNIDYLKMQYPAYLIEQMSTDKLENYTSLYFITPDACYVLSALEEPCQIIHFSTLLYERVQKEPDDSLFCLHVYTGFADFFVKQEGKLLLLNRFLYHTAYDALYYVLNTFKQFNMTPETATVLLSGNPGDELSQLLDEYFAHVKIQDLRFKI